MRNKFLPMAAIAAAIAFTGCSVEKVDPNYASKASGTYVMKSYVTQAGSSTPGANDKVLLSRKDDNHVKLVIDYADNTNGADVTADDVSVTKNGDKYDLSQNFSNATLTGRVDGNNLSVRINYTTTGKYVEITAVK